MENSVSQFPSDFKVEEEAYSKVLQQNPEVSTDLPKWRTSSDVWGDMVRSWKEYIQDIYEKYFKPETDINTNIIDWALVFVFLRIIFWVSLIGLIVYAIFSLYRRFAESDRVKVKEPQIVIATRENRLVDIIKDLMQKGEWSKAAKLRWRLFLERRNLQKEKTPLEFENEANPNLPKAFEQYENMFTGSKSSESWYQDYSKRLRELEGDQ